jgi:hypothetical protein
MTLTVRAIQNWEAEQWVLRKHYAKRMPPISFAYGLYEGVDLIGVVTYGFPASRALCRGLCGDQWVDHVLELNRLVLADNAKNYASVLVGRSLRLLPKPRIVVSYADTAQGHVGYVYQATNWLYTGLSAKRYDSKMPDGETRHSRTLGWIKGAELVERSRKHRYVFFLGSKKQIKQFREILNYPIEPYPKGETRRYDASAAVETQMLLI